MFSTLYGTYFSFQMHFKMLSTIFFNLDQSKISSSGIELKEFSQMHNMKMYTHPCKILVEWVILNYRGTTAKTVL